MHAAFWQQHPGLIWSNRNASDDVRIRAALLRPTFPLLLDIAVEFGPDHLEREWNLLVSDPETTTDRVAPIVTRILTHIRRGYEQARS